MQDKKIRTFIRVILALFIIGFAYALSFTFIVNKQESDIKKNYPNPSIAKGKLDTLYIDNDTIDIAPWTMFWLTDYDYKRAKKNSLNLGLDLKGGMSALLEVSQTDIVKGLAKQSKSIQGNSIFIATLDSLKESGADTFLEDFLDRLDQNNNLFEGAEDKLDLVDIFTSANNPNFNNDEEVIDWLEEKLISKYNQTFESLKRRLDQFGLANPNIQKIENKRQILIELPGMTDKQMVEDYLSATGSLEFRKGVRIGDLLTKKPSLFSDSKFLSFANLPCVNENGDSLPTPCSEGVSGAPNLFYPVQFPDGTVRPVGGPAIANIKSKDKDEAKEYFDSLSREGGDFIFHFTNSPQEPSSNPNPDFIQVIALDNSNGKPLLTGEAVASAIQQRDQSGQPTVGMTMTTSGAGTWSSVTNELKPDQATNKIADHVAIVLDKEVYSYPVVRQQLGFNSEISGNFDIVEAQNIASILNSGQLEAEVLFRSSEYVGPSLGKESVTKGYNSFLIALVFILLYMIFYYAHAGVASNLALIINMFFIFGALAAFNATLTLPGIAGIVLTIGMAVDANVLIYERIKEELSQNKGLSLAVRDGYKAAYSAIIDANLTTLLTAVILFYFGTGPIKGFATTLMIGIMTSLFCAIFITRLVFESRLAKKKRIFFSNRLTNNLFRNTNISFIPRRKWAYVFSTILITVGLVSLFTKKLDLGVDLQGGRSYLVQFQDTDIDISTTDLRNDLGNLFVTDNDVKKYPEVKKSGDFGVNNQVKITTSFKRQDEFREEVKDLLIKGLMTYQNKESEYELEKKIASQEERLPDFSSFFKIISEQEVGPTIADDLRKSAFLSVLFALIVIFAYIFIRFRKWQYSLGAVVALFHDVLIIISIFSLLYGILPFSLEIDQAFIAAILTVIGYSLNDTVVVFDRVREYQKTKVGDGKVIVNNALNSTLSRTVNTSLTTIVVLLIIFIFGGEVIRGFMFALILGVIVGTYSSLFIATPVMVDTSKMKKIT